MIDNDPTLIFLHIPKTAGTTLYGILWRNYDGHAIYTIDGVNRRLLDFHQLSPDDKRSIQLLTGHINFGIHQALPQTATYFTFLRDPVDLVVSYYYFVKNAIEHPHYHVINDNQLSLPEFIASRVDENTRNIQTRLLAGRAHGNAPYDCTATDLAAARANLRRWFTVVGLTEKFDETLILLRRAFGWQHLNYARLNVTRRRPDRDALPPATRAAIINANRLDMELYWEATTLFQEQVRRQGAGFARQVAAFRRHNRRHYWRRYLQWHGRRQTTLLVRRTGLRLRRLWARMAAIRSARTGAGRHMSDG